MPHKELPNFDNFNYLDYYNKHMKGRGLDLEIPDNYTFEKMLPNDPLYSVTPNQIEPYPSEFDDLIRLHYVISYFRPLTLLEIGGGKSTSIILHALAQIREEYSDDISTLRKPYPFKLYSIETSREWQLETNNSISKNFREMYVPILSKIDTRLVANQVCTIFPQFPNISFDFVYLDGPHNYDSEAGINNQSPADPTRMPMAGDFLNIEYFQIPGAVIYSDGRTANMRLLRDNFKMKWDFKSYFNEDVHILRLAEEPLGPYNIKDLIFRKIFG